MGLSPRVRGNLCPLIQAVEPDGSIPARAGEPQSQRRRIAYCPVYPRACGGTPPDRSPSADPDGLSPRVRGNPIPSRRRQSSPGSIPARAGEPAESSNTLTGVEVYPRACGGTVFCDRVQPPHRGLSPRVRGNPVLEVALDPQPGSIPARAGEPSDGAVPARGRRVYPRACGGTYTGAMIVLSVEGLSPRVRGNRARAGCGGSASGSIPARAGEPIRATCCPPRSRVYPRACGGTLAPPPNWIKCWGLSPRVRGNPQQRRPARRHHGSIPARAGEPVLAFHHPLLA